MPTLDPRNDLSQMEHEGEEDARRYLATPKGQALTDRLAKHNLDRRAKRAKEKEKKK